MQLIRNFAAGKGNDLRALDAALVVLARRALSAAVCRDCARSAVESNSSAVGHDPLWTGVAEGQTDADHGFCVVASDLADDRITLSGAKTGAVQLATPIRFHS